MEGGLSNTSRLERLGSALEGRRRWRVKLVGLEVGSGCQTGWQQLDI
jgi:hypothetical protein